MTWGPKRINRKYDNGGGEAARLVKAAEKLDGSLINPLPPAPNAHYRVACTHCAVVIEECDCPSDDKQKLWQLCAACLQKPYERIR